MLDTDICIYLLNGKAPGIAHKLRDLPQRLVATSTITAAEFIRRFFLHILPQGFCRIRHYGFLANRDRKTHLIFIRRLLKWTSPLLNITHSLKEMMLKITGINITLCPCCKKGEMQRVIEIPPGIGKHPFSFIRPPNYQPSG